MPGDSIELTKTTSEFGTAGIPLCIITTNGGHREGVDDCALFRLTDDGLVCYYDDPAVPAGILTLRVNGEPAVREISRHPTMGEAREAYDKLVPDEQARTLIRSVPRESGPTP